MADCVLLFSLNHLNAFPIDTWIRKGMEQKFFEGKNKTDKEILKFAQKNFGGYAGYAQEFLFYYLRDEERKNRILPKKNT